VSWDTILPRNVGIPLPSDTVRYPRRRESFKDTLLVTVTTGVIVIKARFVCVHGNNIKTIIPTMSTFRVVSMDHIVFHE